MIVWGGRLVEVTWHNTIAIFRSFRRRHLPAYTDRGVCLLLFIVERIFLGVPPDPIGHLHEIAID